MNADFTEKQFGSTCYNELVMIDDYWLGPARAFRSRPEIATSRSGGGKSGEGSSNKIRDGQWCSYDQRRLSGAARSREAIVDHRGRGTYMSIADGGQAPRDMFAGRRPAS